MRHTIRTQKTKIESLQEVIADHETKKLLKGKFFLKKSLLLFSDVNHI